MRNTEVIIQGAHGLHYLTDTDNRGIFIAAASLAEAERLAAIARKALREPRGTVPLHEVYDHEKGGRVTVPMPEPLTPEQRMETVLLLQCHLLKHFERH
jgi:hypothetical protein